MFHYDGYVKCKYINTHIAENAVYKVAAENQYVVICAANDICMIRMNWIVVIVVVIVIPTYGSNAETIEILQYTMRSITGSINATPF